MATQPQNWEKVKNLFQEALELDGGARLAFLRDRCSDAEVRSEVERLLAEHDQAGAFLSRPAFDGFPLGAEAPPKDPFDTVSSLLGLATTADIGELSGTVIGRYHLLERIGEGGMGEVWRAEQKEPIRRCVALKLVKAGMNTREVIRRFESERQALALMDHPAIAKVFDAGSTPRGAPYFVMEYVAGAPITAYCDDHRLNLRERLDLFVHVCEGVQHAHQKAIIHRDLKPSNVLVTELDGSATPKIIDFGVAKALAQSLTADATFTRVGVLVGTPEYMSPEQAKSSGKDIDTRTDVYSLGIIFYELLAGVPPIELRGISFEEFLRRLREDEPSKPSAKLRTLDCATSTDIARKRRTQPVELARQIYGELDSIALKALQKDRSQRYSSASDFSADIRRYLNNQAVLAVPPSPVYRVRKFARRYRAAIISTCAFALMLIVAAVITIRESVRAKREGAISEAVNAFLRDDLLAQASTLKQAGPGAKPDPHLEVRTALEHAAAKITSRLNTEPEVEASIRDTIGDSYMDLGLYPEAREQLERALDLHRRVQGDRNPKTLKTMSHLGHIAELQGKKGEAESLLSQTVKIERQVLGPEHPDTLRTINNLANVYDDEGKYAQAETLHSHALESRRRVLGPEHPDTLSSMNNLGIVYDEEGKYGQAEALDSQALEIERRVLGPEHPDTLACMNNLALVYENDGRFTQAEMLYAQVLETQRRVLGPEHSETLRSMNNLANAYADQGKYGQAEALDRQALAISRRALGAEHPETLASMDSLAVVYGYEGKYGQAEVLFTQILEMTQRLLGPEHPDTLGYLWRFASMYQRQGKYSLAETYAQQALAGRRHALGSEQLDTITSVADLALAYLSERKSAESEPLARETLEFYQKHQPKDWQLFRAEALLGASLAGQKKYTEAEPLLLEGYEGMVSRKNRIAVPEQYHLHVAYQWLAHLYKQMGKPPKPAEMAKEYATKVPRQD